MSAPRARSAIAAPPSREGDRSVVWLEGEHDISTAFVLTDTLTSGMSLDDSDLIVELSVSFIGVATIDELLRSRNVLRTSLGA